MQSLYDLVHVGIRCYLNTLIYRLVETLGHDLGSLDWDYNLGPGYFFYLSRLVDINLHDQIRSVIFGGYLKVNIQGC